jgi:hypothetical protein
MDLSCPALVNRPYDVYQLYTLMALDYTYAGSFRFESSDEESEESVNEDAESEEAQEEEQPEEAQEEEQPEDADGTGSSNPHGSDEDFDDTWLSVYNQIRDVSEGGNELAMFYITGGGGPTVGYCFDRVNGVRRFVATIGSTVFSNIPEEVVVIQRWNWRNTPPMQVREVAANDTRYDHFNRLMDVARDELDELFEEQEQEQEDDGHDELENDDMREVTRWWLQSVIFDDDDVQRNVVVVEGLAEVRRWWEQACLYDNVHTRLFNIECYICGDELNTTECFVLPCGHAYCKPCHTGGIRFMCPLCRRYPMTDGAINYIDIAEYNIDEFGLDYGGDFVVTGNFFGVPLVINGNEDTTFDEVRADLAEEFGTVQDAFHIVRYGRNMQGKKLSDIVAAGFPATIDFIVVVRGGGKRGRQAAGGEDKQVKLAGMRADISMKTNLLNQSEVPSVRDFARQLAQRQNHWEWFDQQIQAQSLETLKELSTQFVKTSNSTQKVRLISKMLFDPLMERLAALEHEFKTLKEVQHGLFDSYVEMVTASAYMTNEGMYDWSSFTKSLDAIVTSRVRDEGRAEAQAGMRVG